MYLLICIIFFLLFYYEAIVLGRHSCEIEISSKGFTDTVCPKNLRGYLQAEYDCMQGKVE